MNERTIFFHVFIAILFINAFDSTSTAQDGPRYSHTGPTLITGVRVIDGLGGKPNDNQDIVLINGKIASIRPAGAHDGPEDALMINGKGMTAMPGLIDMHVHLQGGWANGTIRGERYKPRYDDKSVQQSMNAHLYAGVTTVLDCGSDHEYILKWRKRINDGDVFGPSFLYHRRTVGRRNRADGKPATQPVTIRSGIRPR